MEGREVRCELCGNDLNEDTMVCHGEFFVCEDCDDAEAAGEAAKAECVGLDEVAAGLSTKH